VQVQKAHRRRAAAVRALWATSAAVAALTVFLAADAASGWAEGRRLAVYLVVAAASGTAVAGLALAAWLRIPSPLYVARLIERYHPELKNALITFVELESDPPASRRAGTTAGGGPAEDPSVAAAVGRQAARVLSGADPTEFLPSRGIRTPAMAAAAAVSILAGVLWMGQGVLFRPWVSAAQASPAAGEQATSPTTLAPLKEPALSVRPAASAGSGQAASAGSGQAASAENRSEALGAAIQADREKLERLAEALAATAAGPGSSAASAGSGQAGSAAQSAAPTGRMAGDARGGTGQGTTQAASGGATKISQNGGCHPQTKFGGDAATGQGTPKPHRLGVAPDSGSSEIVSKSAGGSAAGGAVKSSAAPGRGQPPEAESAGQASGEPLPNDGGDGAGDDGAAGATAGLRPGAAGLRPGGPTPPKQPLRLRRLEAGTGGSVAGGMPAARQGGSDGPPLVQRPQTADFPRNTLDAMRRVRRLIEEADGRIRDGEVNDAFLGRMGMSHAEFHRFVAAWQRTLETSAPEADAPAGVSGVVESDATARGELIRPAMGSESRPVLGAAAADKGDLVQGGDSRVSLRLRPAVAAYFEAVGRLAAEKTVKGSAWGE